ncbi:hypothetical protein PIB30_013264 [Stylosanthes scabra]|uniref:DUF4283 domain-containing protein n=1 Tax=Stylosanthes scabra TaxID=79078 RepID=A0ABU6R6I8_9FABA|nr:hypothetical protein [Stylosanthes scabra]
MINKECPGEIECKDVGPYRCLITFSSQEIKEESIKNELLTSTFDEIRSHWKYFSSLSRRVWIELMGLPIGLWKKETFNSFASLWGKMVKMDDRTEESKSFTRARFIIDCFQWERVHEWVSVKVDDREFEVFAKEFGSEVYSVQLHPDLEEVDATWMEEDERPIMASVVAESSAVAGTLLVGGGQNNSKLKMTWDPLQEDIIKCKSLSMLDCNHIGGFARVEDGEILGGYSLQNKSFETVGGMKPDLMMMGLNPMDPMLQEAQGNFLEKEGIMEVGFSCSGPKKPGSVQKNCGNDMGCSSGLGLDSSNSFFHPSGLVPNPIGDARRIGFLISQYTEVRIETFKWQRQQTTYKVVTVFFNSDCKTAVAPTSVPSKVGARRLCLLLWCFRRIQFGVRREEAWRMIGVMNPYTV